MDKGTFSEINDLMLSLVGRESQSHGAEVITVLFNLHNKAYPFAQEHSRSCSGCRVRVYQRLKTFWAENKATYGF